MFVVFNVNGKRRNQVGSWILLRKGRVVLGMQWSDTEKTDGHTFVTLGFLTDFLSLTPLPTIR